jgi:transcriptional regulator with XRE-family HTH domain
MDLSKKMRKLRKEQRLTLNGLSAKSGLSCTYLSQIERDLCNPSIGALKRIADALNTSIISLMGFDEVEKKTNDSDQQKKDDKKVAVVKKDRRKTLVYPGGQRKAFLLTPDLQRKMEVLLTHEEPQREAEEDWYQHEGEEFGLILEGRYEVTVENQTYILEEGDSIYFQSQLPHKMRSIGEKAAKTLWIITPPSF